MASTSESCNKLSQADKAVVEVMPAIYRMAGRAASRYGLDRDDLAHYTLEKLLHQMRKVDECDNPVTLAMYRADRIIKNGIKREISGNKGRQRDAISVDDDESPVVIAADTKEVDPIAQMRVADVVAGLTDRQRQVYEAIYVCDMTPVEVADALGVTLSSVQDVRNAIIKKMRKAVGVAEPEKGTKDNTVYTWEDKDGKRHKMTRHEFHKVSGVPSGHTSDLIKRKAKTRKGWRFCH